MPSVVFALRDSQDALIYSFATEGNPEMIEVGGMGYRLNEVLIPRRDGALSDATPSRTPLTIPLRGSLSGVSQEEARAKIDDLKGAIQRGRLRFYLWDDRFVEVIVRDYMESYPSGGGMHTMDFALTLAADDPRSYAAVLTSAAYVGGQQPLVSNPGNLDTAPTITITGPAGGLTALSATNQAQGKTLSWAGSLAQGVVMVIDFKARAVAVAGASNPKGLSGSFWSLSRGNNQLAFTTTPTAAPLTFAWRSAWA